MTTRTSEVHVAVSLDAERLSQLPHETGTVAGRCATVGPACDNMMVCPDTEAPYSLYHHVAGRPPSREHPLYVALEDLRHEARHSEQADDELDTARIESSSDSTAFQGSAQRVRVSDWIADAKVTISTYGKEFQFTGKADINHTGVKDS